MIFDFHRPLGRRRRHRQLQRRGRRHQRCQRRWRRHRLLQRRWQRSLGHGVFPDFRPPSPFSYVASTDAAAGVSATEAIGDLTTASSAADFAEAVDFAQELLRLLLKNFLSAAENAGPLAAKPTAAKEDPAGHNSEAARIEGHGVGGF